MKEVFSVDVTGPAVIAHQLLRNLREQTLTIKTSHRLLDVAQELGVVAVVAVGGGGNRTGVTSSGERPSNAAPANG